MYKIERGKTMGDEGRLYLGLFLGILFLIFKGFFTACETAVIEVNDTKIKKQAETDKKSKRLLELIEHPNRLLVSLSVIKALTAVIITIIATVTFYTPLKNLIGLIGSHPEANGIMAIFIIVIIVTVILTVFSDSIPKKLALKNSESFALDIAGFLKATMLCIYPLTKIISAFTFIFGKLFGFSNSADKDVVTEEEILMMVDAVNETGVIEESQKEMINNVFEFDDLEVSYVMTHRTDIVAVEKNSSIKELVAIAIDEGFSRVPVYDNSIDNIIGVIYVKDLLAFIGSDNVLEEPVSELIREILYIPQTNRCGELFKELTSMKAQIAVVVDEYGGTAGLVSMEDLVEAIVGNIQDEYDDEIEEIIEIADGEYKVSGTADPHDVFEELGLSLPDEHDYDTIGGFVIDLLGHIPYDDELPSIEHNGYTFTVLSTEEKRIETLMVVKNKPTV